MKELVNLLVEDRLLEIKKSLDDGGKKIADSLVKKVLTRVSNEMCGLFVEGMNSTLAEFVRQLPHKIIHENQAWSHINNDSMEVLPEGIKYYCTTKSMDLVVVEQKPQVRTVKFSDYYRDLIPKDDKSYTFSRYRLSFPYVIFILTIEKIDREKKTCRSYVFYRNAPLTKLTDVLGCSNLPNIDGNSRICLGEFNNEVSSIHDVTSRLISYFWQTSFNSDYAANFYHSDPRLKYVTSWQDETAKDSSFIFDVQWQRVDTLENIKNRLLQRESSKESYLTVPHWVNKEAEKIRNGICRQIEELTKFEQYKELTNELVAGIMTEALKGGE